jgi:1-deoxy-D-xylulose-5-phosphate reductoisomerase
VQALTKRIAILGSTGSIGTQALEVIRAHPEEFVVEVLTAGSNSDLLIQQAIEFRPDTVVIGNKAHYGKVSDHLNHYDIKVFAGEESIEQVVSMENIDLVLSALVGFSGLKPALAAVRAGKDLALANKESLVVAGDLIMAAAREQRVWVLPVDSEHSAIFQCLAGEAHQSVEKVILTASGGPFRGWTRDRLSQVNRDEALNHPNWKMGHKVTIDSATLMNKGLEIIEARWLFALAPHQISVIIHPQSVIHSMVQFIDGSIKAQMGVPDMKLPIRYALGYPARIKDETRRFSFIDYPMLTFEDPDLHIFRNLALAFEAMHAGGNMPCILNAANEKAVTAFLERRIGFFGMTDVIAYCMSSMPVVKSPGMDDYMETHLETVIRAGEFINKISH